MNAGLVVVIVGVGWTLLALVVAMAVGNMARDRDVGAGPSMAPPARDDGFRAAV